MNFPILLAAILAVSALSGAEPSPSQSDTIPEQLKAVLPFGWNIVEVIPDQIPHGHYPSEDEGPTGQEFVIQGPADVTLHWRDRQGVSHHSPIAKETLRIWIMPSEYQEKWTRHFILHRRIPAELIVSEQEERIYGFQTHRILDRDAFDSLLKEATYVAWPDTPHDNQNPLSWRSWRKELRNALTRADDPPEGPKLRSPTRRGR